MANTDNSTAAIIDQSNRRVLEGYPFFIDCGVLGEDNLDQESGQVVVTWYKDGTSLSTGLSYSVEKPTSEDTGTYYFTATNAYGTTTSDSVDVEIVTPSPAEFGPNLIQNGMAENGLSSWTPQLGTMKLQKFWGKAGDLSWVGGRSRYPDPAGIDPLYAQRDGLAFFTAEDFQYRMRSGDTVTFIKSNQGGNLTTAYQDVIITDPTTLDIIDRKIEGVFDVEAKCFGYLGQAKAVKIYKHDNKYEGEILSPSARRKDGSDSGYEEIKRHCHDESKLRYEFFDANDELMKSFEMDSFRPTKTNHAFVIGYNSLSIPPGTRRVRVHMMFRRHNREFTWNHMRGDFAQSYFCGIHAVNMRIFINKDGLKFPSVKFDPDDVIDSELSDLLEQQIMDSQLEIAKCRDLIEDVGNIEVRNSITSDYKFPSQKGVKQEGLMHLAKWCRDEHQRLFIFPTAGARPLPGKQGSVYYDQNRVMISPQNGPLTVNASHMPGTVHGRAIDWSVKIGGANNTNLVHHIQVCGDRIPNFGGESAEGGHKLLHHINYFYMRDDIITAIKEAWEDDNPEAPMPWWEERWRKYVYNTEQEGCAFKWGSQIKKFIGCIAGIPGYDGAINPTSIDPRVLIAFALASHDVGTISTPSYNYPRTLKYLFYRPSKHDGFDSNSPYAILGSLGNATEQISQYYGGFGNYYTNTYWQPFYGNWTNTFKKYQDVSAANYSLYNKTGHNHPHWIGKGYLEAFLKQLDSYGEDRVYDDTIQMTIREIYDSVLDPDYSNAIYPDTVRMFTPPSALRTRHWEDANPDDPDTWNNLDVAGDYKEDQGARVDDVSESGKGSFTYTMINQGNYKIGFSYPCEMIDKNPVSLNTGDNNGILRMKDEGVTKIVWPQLTYHRWFQHPDLMYDMNRYTVMDYSLDDMVDKIDEIPALGIFFETTKSPIVFNEKISMRPVPFDGDITGNLTFTDASRKNTWHGYYSHYKHMMDNLEIDTSGYNHNGSGFERLNTSKFENHKGLCIPEFYKQTVLSGDTNNMPEDAPFRYQGANPVKCLTDYENTDGLTDFSIDKMNNLGATSANSQARLDKLLRTYGMAFARKYLLNLRIKWLNEALQESLDWVDTQGDEYGYDQTQTAVQDD